MKLAPQNTAILFLVCMSFLINNTTLVGDESERIKFSEFYTAKSKVLSDRFKAVEAEYIRTLNHANGYVQRNKLSGQFGGRNYRMKSAEDSSQALSVSNLDYEFSVHPDGERWVLDYVKPNSPQFFDNSRAYMQYPVLPIAHERASLLFEDLSKKKSTLVEVVQFQPGIEDGEVATLKIKYLLLSDLKTWVNSTIEFYTNDGRVKSVTNYLGELKEETIIDYGKDAVPEFIKTFHDDHLYAEIEFTKFEQLDELSGDFDLTGFGLREPIFEQRPEFKDNKYAVWLALAGVALFGIVFVLAKKANRNEQNEF